MTLCDAGPLIAIIDADEPDHDACLAAARRARPAPRDDMAGIHRGDVPTRPSRWDHRSTGAVESGSHEPPDLADLSTKAVERSAQLMDKYADRPMDLADATLVALAEEQGHRKVFSLDSDFHIYRIRGRQRFDVVPRR